MEFTTKILHYIANIILKAHWFTDEDEIDIMDICDMLETVGISKDAFNVPGDDFETVKHVNFSWSLGGSINN